MSARNGWIVALAFLLLFAACGGPSTPSGGSPDGGNDLGQNPFDATPSPLVVELVPEAGAARSEAVPIEGGIVRATGADGTVYTLSIPEGALLEATTITMTPIASVEGFSIEGARALGVELEPEGLEFYRAATLTVTPSDLPASTSAISFLQESGSHELHLYTVDPTTGAMVAEGEVSLPPGSSEGDGFLGPPTRTAPTVGCSSG